MCSKTLALALLLAAWSAVAWSSTACDQPEGCSEPEPRQASALLQARHDPSLSDIVLLEQPTGSLLTVGSVIALRGGKANKYCSDTETASNTFICDRNTAGPWEHFTVEDAGSGKRALRGGRSNQICSDEGEIHCNRGTIGNWEKFTVEDAGSGKIALIGSRNSKYCSDESPNPVKCDRNSLLAYEQFTVEYITTTTTAAPTVAPTAAPTAAPAATGAVNPSGAAAPLDETGYAAVGDRCCQAEMKQFIERQAINLGLEVCDPFGLEGIVAYHSCDKGLQTFDALTSNLLTDSTQRCKWLATSGTCTARPSDCPTFSGMAPASDCGCSRSKAATVTLTEASITQNNMAGLGPTSGPQELRYSNVGMSDTGAPFDIVVTMLTTGYSRGPFQNGVTGAMGRLTLDQRAGGVPEHVTFKFTFVEPGSNTPLKLNEVHLATFDLDGTAANGIETVSAKGYKGYVTDVTPSVVASKLPDGRTKFSSAGTVNDIPNANDPNSLTVEQQANSIMYFFENVTTFDLEFGIESTASARNLFFAFGSTLNSRCGP